MQKVSATILLKEEILIKQAQLEITGKLLKNDFHLMYESLKPANLLKHAIKDMSESPGIKNTIIDSSLGLTVGYLSKKIILGMSKNPFLKFVGPILQFGISTIVMKNPEIIKSTARYILKSIFPKKEPESEKSI